MRNNRPAPLLGDLRGSLRSDLVTQRCQVPLEAFVLALQRLHAGQVVAVVVRVQSLVLLLDPLLRLVGISEE